MRRNVTRHRDLVGAGAMGQQLALFVPNNLFHREPTHALHVGTLDLTLVNGGVDGLTRVVHDVHACQPPLAGAGVNFCFRNRCAVAEIIERLALQGHEVVGNVRRHVEAAGAQAYAVQPRLLGEVFPCNHLVRAAVGTHRLAAFDADVAGLTAQHIRSDRLQTFTQWATGVSNGCAVDVGTTGGCGCRRIGHLLRIGCCDANQLKVNAQRVGRNLRHFGI